MKIALLWWVESATKMAKLNPYEFKIPPAAESKSLKPGDFAKILFKFKMSASCRQSHGERMWVQVVELLKGGRYRGRLSNDPVHAPMRLGEVVDFGASHVLAVMRKTEAPEFVATKPEDLKDNVAFLPSQRNDPKRHLKGE